MYEFLATLTLIIHFLFIIFVIFGGLLFFVKAWTLYFHVPAFFYGVYVEFTQRICPLTYLENYFLTKANLASYSASFIQNYLYAIIYPIIFKTEPYRRDTCRLVYWCNPFEPINKGKLGSTQGWRKEKKFPVYY